METRKINIPDTYEKVMQEELPDIHAEGILLRHKKSGARVLLLPSADENKVFNIAFRTPPSDSTGTAHIIEHTVLCGSEHFPLKDPFVQLIQGSLNTFLNAITYPDKTMYPVASTNDADFRNLMHVYLDAVFFPNIYHEENIFRQEGWHYELESRDDDLTLNGVVYNEMKGAFSSADEVLEREIMNSLFPDTSYGVESGGDPEVIPSLTYEQYLDFHRKYYHPSNSYICLYGDLDMADALTFIDREYLSLFDAQETDSAIARQEAFDSERVVRGTYPLSDEEETENNTYLSYSIAAGDFGDVKEMIALDILDYALLASPGAPVRKALMDAGIGLDIYGGLSDGILQPYYSITAKNANASDAERFRDVIRKTLLEEAEKGVDRSSLKAGIHSMEFSFREADYGTTPKGLYYCIYALETWLYDDAAPFSFLKQLDAYRELKELADTGYFENLIREKLLGTKHCSLVVLAPEKGLAKKKEQETAALLAEKKAAMAPEELDACIAATKALKEWQMKEDSEEAIASLPVLKRSDLRRKILPHSNIEETCRVALSEGGEVQIPCVLHEAECSGIGYLELIFNAKRLPAEMVPYLGLLRAVLSGVSTRSYSYQELTNAINEQTGGISFTISTTDVETDPCAYRALFSVRMKALAGELSGGTKLIGEILHTSDFDDGKRLKEILSQTRSRLQMTLQQSGHVAAAVRAAAATASDSAFLDQVSGIAFYRFIRDLEENAESMQEEISGHLKEVAGMLFRSDNVIASFTSDKEDRGVLAEILGNAFVKVPEGSALLPECEIAPYGRENIGFTTPGQVQYVAMAGSSLKSGIPYTGSVAVLRHMLNFEYLWQNVRVMGGAYGCSSNFRRNGRGVLASYRDPNLKKTVEVFREAAAYLEQYEADEDTMTKYVIGTFSGLDTPLTPSGFGLASMRDYLRGVTDEMRQAFRDEVLGTTAADIRSLAGVLKALAEDSCLCVVGGETAVGEEKDLFDKVEVLL